MAKNLTCCSCGKSIINDWWIRINKLIYCKLCKNDLDIFMKNNKDRLLKVKLNSFDNYKTYNRWLLDKSLPQLRKLIK